MFASDTIKFALLSKLILCKALFCSFNFISVFLFLFLPDLFQNLFLSLFASVRLILPSLILFKKLKALSNLSNSALAVLPLYLYFKSS